jgi:type I restriction enzyme S subunit
MSEPVPNGWSKVEFNNFTTLQRGKDLTKAEFREGTVPVAGSNGVIGYHDTAIAIAPGITVGRSGSAGKVTVYEEDFWPHNTSLYVRDFHGNDPYFAGFLLGSLNLARFKTGASVPTLDRNSFKTLPLLVPPLPEQKKIAHILSTVQRAIEAQERIIQTTTELKKALMHKLFTEGLRGEPQKQTEIGAVPETWEIKTVRDYCDILNGYAFKSEDYVTTGGIPNFRVVNISWDGTVSMDDCKLLPESFSVSHEKYLLNEGDILFVMVGATRGKLAQIPASILPALMNQNMWRIVPSREGIDRDYLFHHLRRSVVGLLQEDDDQARGFFKKSDFRDIPLAIPSLQEQIEIRTALGTLETKLGLHAAKTVQLKDLFRTLLHELMTAKTRVHKAAFEV